MKKNKDVFLNKLHIEDESGERINLNALALGVVALIGTAYAGLHVISIIVTHFVK